MLDLDNILLNCCPQPYGVSWPQLKGHSAHMAKIYVLTINPRIYIIFHSIIVQDQRLWYDLDSRSRSQCTNIAKFLAKPQIPTARLDLDISHNCYPFSKGVSRPWPSLCQLHWSFGHDRCELTRTCEMFPICDDKITENDWCVRKIIGIHCWPKVMLPRSQSHSAPITNILIHYVCNVEHLRH